MLWYSARKSTADHFPISAERHVQDPGVDVEMRVRDGLPLDRPGRRVDVGESYQLGVHRHRRVEAPASHREQLGERLQSDPHRRLDVLDELRRPHVVAGGPGRRELHAHAFGGGVHQVVVRNPVVPGPRRHELLPGDRVAARPQGGDRLRRGPLIEAHARQDAGIADGLGDPLGDLHVRAQLGALDIAGDVRLVLRRVLLVVGVVVRLSGDHHLLAANHDGDSQTGTV